MRWSEATTLEFVRQYLKHDCLWNPAHPSYKLKYKREKAYSVIMREFGDSSGKYLSLAEVKNKIKNLRTTYSQQVQKILTKSSPNAIYEPSLVWFHEMDACLKNIPSSGRLMALNSQEQELPEVDSSSQSVWPDTELLTSSFESTSTDPLVPPTENESEETIQESSRIYLKKNTDNESEETTNEPSCGYLKRNKRKKIKRTHKQPVQNYIIDTRTNEDEFDIYGQYIASQLRKMELHKALRVQLEIQNIVSGARLSVNDDAV